MTDDQRPVRVQLRRAKGWRKPPGAVVVARPTRWGNPYPVSQYGRIEALRLYREWITEVPELVAAVCSELAGADLACWCPLDQPCHADVLLELANPRDRGEDMIDQLAMGQWPRPRRAFSPPRIAESDRPSETDVERARQEARRGWTRIVRLR